MIIGTAGLATPPTPPTPPWQLWLPWLFLGLLVLPFHPFWVDFEQVRRGLLLLLTGVALLVYPRLPRVRGDALWLAVCASMVIAAVISVRSLQPWEAIYRIAHFGALLLVLRIGAIAHATIAGPLTWLLAITALFGLLQRLGIAELAGYGSALEPVSTFGNLNVASEWTAVAAMAVLVLLPTRRWLHLLALALAGGYLVVNGSRAGLIAFGIGLVLFALKRRQVTAMSGPGCALAGAGIAWLLTLALPLPAPPDYDAEIAMKKRAEQTIAVRLEIAKASSELIAERPLFGFGPGQFQVQYPRVRHEAEIEASSHGRQFAAEVRTAHDDWVELLVEGGFPLVLLLAAALFALQRGTRDKERLLPLAVLLLLMLARSPLANAPAIAAALLPIATMWHRPTPIAAWQPWVMRALGAVLAVLGLLPIVSHFAFAPYLAAIARGTQPDSAAVHRAHAWMPWEPRWLQVMAREYLAQGNLEAATRTAARASQLRPHDPHLLLLVGEVLARRGAYQEAEAVARHGLQFDANHPELRVLRSTALLLSGRYDEAVIAVTDRPHPVLRAALASHFRALAEAAAQRGDPKGAARCDLECAFLDALETVGDQSPGALSAMGEHLKTMVIALQESGMRADLRLHLLSGLHYLALDKPLSAANHGTAAQALDLALPAWQRALFGDKLAPLLQQEVWRDVLRRG